MKKVKQNSRAGKRLHNNIQFEPGVASLAGFEPATRCLEGSRSILLSYRDGFIFQFSTA